MDHNDAQPPGTIRVFLADDNLIVPGGCASLWSIYPVLAYRGRGPPEGRHVQHWWW